MDKLTIVGMKSGRRRGLLSAKRRFYRRTTPVPGIRENMVPKRLSGERVVAKTIFRIQVSRLLCVL